MVRKLDGVTTHSTILLLPLEVAIHITINGGSRNPFRVRRVNTVCKSSRLLKFLLILR